jgi:NAD(P)-dependent dehydrogenase (short-subunit alcohol dehydrogenase family)
VNLQLDGKRALISGSTSGIGLAIATTLAGEGVRVSIAGRSNEKLQRARESIQSSSHGETHVIGVVADLGAAEGVETMIKSVPDVDILVNNLGIYETKSFFELQDSDWMRLFEINVMSGVRLARHYLRGMLERNFGRIIFISSESGIMTPPEMIHYGFTKSAQLAVARGLAELTKGTNVTVNSILPGPTLSEGIVEFLRSMSSKADPTPEEAEKEFFDKHRSSSLLQRLIDAREIANLIII